MRIRIRNLVLNIGNQCSRSVTFWYGSGYKPLTTDPDPTPDPAPNPVIFVSDLQDDN
jgi:hypothetical protein